VLAVQAFLAVEAAGGLLLLGATAVALAWANVPGIGGYDRFVHLRVPGATALHLPDTLHHLVGDGLMALFFLVVGLEIAREWAEGELRDRRAAALPALAALGGMVVPAAIYAVANAGHPGARGWGIPMATDIAFALGVLSLLGRRVPPALKVFLLTLAIVDDIGAIVVIAVWYTATIAWAWLGAAVALVVVALALRRWGRLTAGPFAALGVALWLCTYRSGVHATIAGVALGLLAPRAVGPAAAVDDAAAGGGTGDDAEGLAGRLERGLHPWTGYLIVPLFALVNAGIDLGAGVDPTTRVTVGVAVGLVVGKAVGVGGAALLAIRLGLAPRPDGVRPVQLAGAGVLAGIGFTVSLFVTGLAFGESPLAADAKVGVLAASVVAAAAGATVLAVAGRGDQTRPTSGGISVGT
jgi:NhaA family Na+:H+ antiporter